MPSRLATEIRPLHADDPHFPAGLHDLADTPSILYARGALPPPIGQTVAMVGSRAASTYGRAMAERLAGDLTRLGYAIVSGLARGIDAAAHAGAMNAGGGTWAVLPSGLDAITPRHHERLAESIMERGGLVTEIAGGGPRGKGEFIRRNRLIAALASAVVVVEAAGTSGALATAAAGRRLGRQVLAVPGDVDRETARGCHRLLRQGAALCEEAHDVIVAIERWRAERGSPATGDGAPRTAAARVLRALATRARTLEALARHADLAPAETLAALLSLEWGGSARRWPGPRWSRVEP
ncbi:MAG: DNA-protecting protein DprA [Candidatus Eisenbacteria bacterium]|uniref:DNA-protecting protein DprA n=1 Tax=Eiseniibacteriota bacterium TaxID=2212470 RepID=A0A538UC95_UNCEI|nr:MAG: DNA-protecting protein DprA [Candidatus Eisenbacteria bacterium]